MSNRDAVIEIIRRMPEDISISEIISELSVRQKVDEGLRELDSGRGIPHEEVKQELSRWRN
jgi:predicted transcriptional regulator